MRNLVDQYIDEDGYAVVDLKKDGVTERHRVHELVARTFVPNPNNLPHIRHIDGNRRNNHASNLEWCAEHPDRAQLQ